jgi:lipoyl(octanoyl) transferase
MRSRHRPRLSAGAVAEQSLATLGWYGQRMSDTHEQRGFNGEIWVCHLGTVPYRHALAIQEQVRAARLAGELPDTLLLLEHPPVYTRGRRSRAEDLPLGERFYRAQGIDVVDVDRGGKLTYHGPGQLVGYPIVRIDDIGLHLRTMEAAIVHALAQVGIAARSRHHEGIDYTGVWVQDRKIASIGVHVSRGVATHGFAVNVHNDLQPFSWVTACGLANVAMTSVAHESTGECEALRCFRKRIAHALCQAHGKRQRLVSPARLGIDTANPSSIKTISSRLVEAVPA